MALHGKNIKVYVDQYDMTAYLDKKSPKYQGEALRSTTFGNSAHTYQPGLRNVALAFEGFTSGTAASLDDLLAARVNAGVVITSPYDSGAGALCDMVVPQTVNHDVNGSITGLVRTSANFSGNEGLVGVMLDAGQTITANTTTTGVDGGAATTLGGVAHIHVTAGSGAGTLYAVIQGSADNSTWTTWDAFSAISGAPTSARIQIYGSAGTIPRYLRVQYVVSGSGSWTCVVAVARRYSGALPGTIPAAVSFSDFGTVLRRYSFTEATYLYQNTAASTPVTTTGQNIKAAVDSVASETLLAATNYGTWEVNGEGKYGMRLATSQFMATAAGQVARMAASSAFAMILTVDSGFNAQAGFVQWSSSTVWNVFKQSSGLSNRLGIESITHTYYQPDPAQGTCATGLRRRYLVTYDSSRKMTYGSMNASGWSTGIPPGYTAPDPIAETFTGTGTLTVGDFGYGYPTCYVHEIVFYSALTNRALLEAWMLTQ